MSCSFDNIINCTQECVLQCCNSIELFEINSSKFWLEIQQDETPEAMRFSHEKSIYLDDLYGSVLVLGINPKNEFKISFRLEMRTSHNVLSMDTVQYSKFSECLHHHFSTNSIYPEISMMSNNETMVQLIRFQQKTFKLRVGVESITINEEVLYNLYISKSYINMYILMLDYERKQYESQFFKLLNHFCYTKSLSEVRKMTHSIQLQAFFDDILNSHCDCIDKIFILEIATNFTPWFKKCVQIFMQSMKNEKINLT